jgi:hypothetical protein
LLDADADRADLELRLIKLLLKDRARVHPFAGNGGSWRKAVVRQSSDVCLVMLEAGVRQFGAWGDTDEGRHILIAVARYLAAHSPTERASLQTADIARRLMQGGELHHDVTR